MGGSASLRGVGGCAGDVPGCPGSSIPSARPPFSFHRTGGGSICWRGARSSAAARRLPHARLDRLRAGDEGEESVKAEGEGRSVCHRKRERGGERGRMDGWGGGGREANTSLPATSHQASQPWRQRQINSWPLCDVRAPAASRCSRGRPAIRSTD